jgi:hypothetical protein
VPDFIYSLVEIVGLALQVLLVYSLLRGPFQKYFIIFLYSSVYLITSLLEVIIARRGGKTTPLYSQVYWTNEIVLDLLLFLMVILLTYRATEGSPLRAAAGKLLTGVVVIAVALPFVLGSQPYFSLRWFRLTAQILNFAGAIMNLALWTALIGSRRKDAQLLTVSAGLGVAVTGQAVYYGMRLMTNASAIRVVSDALNVITFLAGVAIWCWAFRPATRSSGPSAQVLSKAS